MLKRLIAVSALALTLVTGATFAAEMAAGTVAEVNTETREVTLDDGKVFVLGDSVDIETVKAGSTVELTYDMMDGKMVVTEAAVK
ncbi:MAG: DUF1344 domain-containing protein [Rhodobiaceae bacterium]|nr:DUF1344 domain-containing protein [Rhodobiaceae bacterium]MCC0011853.1 DUF1344 domain-containing protein [Rhodobiaceae bacterium]MCC0050490.1 DUF1344 domain-containing protein [Rhodobiaceae bacterium]MCC0061229.1 DUF1344 domain-containing protein [Rhodobiaceae bacterium]